jgi:hypothetical protein
MLTRKSKMIAPFSNIYIQNITLEVSEKKVQDNQKKLLFENTLYNDKTENIIIDTVGRSRVISIENEVDDDDEKEEEEEAEEEEEKNIVELFNIKIRGHPREYYTDNAVNGYIYEIGKMDEIGPKVGKFVNGKAVMHKLKVI